MILYWTIRLLAVVAVVLVAPLFCDIAIALAGNLRRSRSRRASLRAIRLAVVVPAHNEELQIAHTVQSLLAAGCVPANQPDTPGQYGARIFVVAHNCSDHTAERAAQAGAVLLELNDEAQRGKGAALRAGFRLAAANGADAFLVIDADSVVTPDLLEAVKRALAAGAEALQCRNELDLPASAGRFSLRRLRALAFRGVNVVRARGRAGMGCSAGIFGNGFALTAATLERVPFTVDSICEDMEYHGKLIVAGICVEWQEQGCVWAQMARAGSVQARQEARWEGGRLRVAAMSTLPLLASAARGPVRAFSVLAEFWSLPVARAVLVLLLALLLPVPWLHGFVAVCAVLALLYVLVAALLGQSPASDLLALCLAPVHLLWKLMTTPMVLWHTRRSTEWARTEREMRQP